MKQALVLTAVLALGAAPGASALPSAVHGHAYPATIPLPNGFQPEGIATGKGNLFYVGSIPTGAVYRGDLRTGKGAVFVQGASGHAATGLKVDHGRIFVSGASTGKAFVYDEKTGSLLKELQLASGTGPTFVNDVVVTKGGAFFTDSSRAVIYRVPASLGTPQTIPLTGDFRLVSGLNLNGIAATPDGRTLIAVQTATGKLFTISPATGATREIDLHGTSLVDGDGILLRGRTLYVVQNSDDRIAVVKLSGDLASGRLTRTITSPGFDVPTTIALHGNRLYAVNARFGTASGPNASYSVVQVRG